MKKAGLNIIEEGCSAVELSDDDGSRKFFRGRGSRADAADVDTDAEAGRKRPKITSTITHRTN
eukprot:scaffold88197_cov37-Cyclotella_meneghiniana.AAC.2